MIIPQHEEKYRMYYLPVEQRQGFKYWLRKGITFLFSQVGVGALLLGYTILGAMLFIGLEARTESRRTAQVSTLRGEMVASLWNVTQSYNLIQTDKWMSDVKTLIQTFQSHLVQEIRLGFDGSSDPIWTFPAALMYSLSVYTTIGYGSPLTPKTKWGKAMTVFYALFGIPLLLLYMANVGNLLANLFRQFYTSVDRCRQNLEKGRQLRRRLELEQIEGLSKQSEGEEENQVEEEELEVIMEGGQEEALDNLSASGNDDNNNPEDVPIPISTCLGVFLCYITFGSFLFSWWEDWGYLDSSYFCFVSLVTIGFGDLVPGDSPEDRRRGHVDSELVFCSIYLLLGMALMAMCFQITQERIFQKARRLGKFLKLI